ncbi:hypothetical protein [Micromonospora sp. NPDC005087]|uniref:hypothetical protein n=1 Tax=Micromonospora sp. NPDC005087 TaxID=3364225 RepID=UPI0036918B63
MGEKPSSEKVAADRITTIILAEFNAARAEILHKDLARISLVSFYVTAMGVTVGLVLSGKSGTSLLLVIPILSSAFELAILGEGRDKTLAGSYVNDVLRPLVIEQTGEDRLLSWESYYRRHSPNSYVLKALAMGLLFPGASLFALVIVVPALTTFGGWALWALDLSLFVVMVLAALPRMKLLLVKMNSYLRGTGGTRNWRGVD